MYTFFPALGRLKEEQGFDYFAGVIAGTNEGAGAVFRRFWRFCESGAFFSGVRFFVLLSGEALTYCSFEYFDGVIMDSDRGSGAVFFSSLTFRQSVVSLIRVWASWSRCGATHDKSGFLVSRWCSSVALLWAPTGARVQSFVEFDVSPKQSFVFFGYEHFCFALERRMKKRGFDFSVALLWAPTGAPGAGFHRL